ncbi:MAG: MASE1 domain-containing protein [Chloroflexota bacterium]
MHISKISRYLAKIIVLAIVYHLTARLSLQMAYVQANTSPVWPPSGIGLAALLILGIRCWPGITLGVVVGSLLTGAPLPFALGLGLANTLEALIGCYLLRKVLRIHVSLDRVRDVVGLVFAAAVSTSVSASIGVASLYLGQRVSDTPFYLLWVTWWIGNLLGMLVVAPFLFVWADQLPKKIPRSLWLEGILFLVLLFLVTGYVFENTGGDGVLHQALLYMIFPFAIWASLRLGQPGAVTTIFAISGISIWDTVHGMGPFSQLPMNDSLILLQTFTGVVSLTTLTLAASATERRHAEEALNRRVEDLAVLNDASKEFLGNVEPDALYEAICRLAVERMGLQAAWIELTRVEQPVSGAAARVLALHQRAQVSADLAEKIIASTPVRKVIRQGEESGRSQALEHATTSADSVQFAGAPLAFAAFPFTYAGNVVGVLCAVTAEPGGFLKEEVLLLESYANLAAMAIQNAWLFNQVRLGNEQLHALSHRLMDVQEEERLHLSRELHDESGQILAALMVRLGLLERDAEIPEQRAAHIVELKQIVKEILNNLHSLAVKLRPASLDHLGLTTALKQYADEYSRQYAVEVQFDALDIETTRLPAEVETALFRIMQESLTNIALHAQAGRVDILLNRRNGCLVMTIEDNGVGFDPNLTANETRLGLFGMRERVEMLGGRLRIESSPGKGTTISVEVPYDHPGARR